MSIKTIKRIVALLYLSLAIASSAIAQKRYDPGASDTEIKFGQTMVYSGPVSVYSAIGRVEAAYFTMLNEAGGINGRKLNFISLDDSYNPSKTVEMVRRLVERDRVLFLMSNTGTASNSAIHRYINNKKIPHLFVASGASKWNDPKNFPWTIGFNPSYYDEGRLYARDILKTRPSAKIAVLMQNDDYGKDYFNGFTAGLGDKAKTMIVAKATYEATDPTIDSQIITLQASGADTLLNISIGKFAAQAIRKVAELGWKPVHYLNHVAAINAVIEPAGLDKSQGLISMAYLKDSADPQWANDPAMKAYLSFMKKYAPDINPNEGSAVFGYAIAQLMTHVLQQCGDNLTRENVMRQAANVKNYHIPIARPGVLVSTSPNDYALFKKIQLVRFEGRRWVDYGESVTFK